MYMSQANKSLTGEVRLSYVHLAVPYANPTQPNAEPKYSATLLIPKTDTATYQDLMNSMNAAVGGKSGAAAAKKDCEYHSPFLMP